MKKTIYEEDCIQTREVKPEELEHPYSPPSDSYLGGGKEAMEEYIEWNEVQIK